MIFRLESSNGQPLYVQLMQQIRHAIETGVLRSGDQLPSIRMLAEQLVVSPTTIVKAYSELAREGVLELQQGSGAFIARTRRFRDLGPRIQAAGARVNELVAELRGQGLRDDEIQRMFEQALLQPAPKAVTRR